MRFPSLSIVLAAIAATVRRFPWSVAAATVSAAAAMVLTRPGVDEDQPLRWLVVGTLGLALLTGLTVAGERRSPRTALLLPLIGVAVLAAVYWLWPRWNDPVQLRRYLQLSLGFHLLAAWLPYALRGEANGFWQYNRHLFLRFLIGALYSGVLYAGLSVAILALDQLFGVDVKEYVYLRLWIGIAFGFQSLYFLGGLSSSFASLQADARYPTGLKVFSQYILLPIVVLYLVILTAYMAKVAITQQWPSGWIGYLVSSVAAAGILSLLLVHPVQERAENRWVRTYSRWFYIALFPSIVMLLLAVWKRIDQYGVTENRYFLVVLSVWLAGVAVYFTASRAKNIKFIPVSLCALAFLSSFGPWGAYSVSARSQLGRLEGLLSESGMLVENAVRAPGGPLSPEQRRELSAITHYLLETHGRDVVTGRLAWPDIADTGHSRAATEAQAMLAAIDVEYMGRWTRTDPKRFRLFSPPPPRAVEVSGLDYAVRIGPPFPARITLGSRELEFSLHRDPPELVLMDGDVELIRLSLEPVMTRAREQPDAGDTPRGALVEPLLLSGEGPGARARVHVISAYGEFLQSGARIRSLNADVFLTLKSSDP